MTVYLNVLVMYSGIEILFIGLFTIIVGLLFTFAGYQFFRVLIPLWGFFAGFSWGAEAVSIGLGEGFLITLTGWTIGLVIGLIIAALAYFFYEAAVAILAGFVGYWLAAGIMLSIGFVPGFFVTSIATIAGIALAVFALILNAPKGFLIVFSALGGATATVGGLMILFGQAPVGILGTGLVNTIIQDSFFWTFSWIGLSIVGAIAQLQFSQELTLDESTYYSSMPMAGAKGGKTTLEDDDET